MKISNCQQQQQNQQQQTHQNYVNLDIRAHLQKRAKGTHNQVLAFTATRTHTQQSVRYNNNNNKDDFAADNNVDDDVADYDDDIILSYNNATQTNSNSKMRTAIT